MPVTTTPEDTLRAAGVDDARQIEYQRKMSAPLAGRKPPARAKPQRVLPGALRGLDLLGRLDTWIFGHEIRNLSFMLQSAAYRSQETGTANVATRRKALTLAARLWDLCPPEDDPLRDTR
jgi:hypothetical protein